MGFLDEYDVRSFPAAVTPEGGAEPATAAWLNAEARGFHDSRLTGKRLDDAAQDLVADGRELVGVYARNVPTHALGTDIPVATFSSFTSTLNVGAPELLPVHLVSNVTVRPTHRRKGMLRHMMTDNLRAAADAGFAVAALTASEATIYRRFGFGAATWLHHVSVITDSRFKLLVTPKGRSEFVEAAQLTEIAPAVFAEFHATHPGSVEQHNRHWDHISGVRYDKGDEDLTVNAAVHYDPSGAIDGYVSYKIRDVYKDTQTLEVIELVATNDDAYLGLWDLLASIDLNDRVEWNGAPAEGPLRWALTDARLVKPTEIEDLLWLRILDVVRAFEARSYVGEGEIVLAVTDSLGYAEGIYRLRIAGGTARVERDDNAKPDVSLEAPALASLYLGGVDPLTLRAAGLLDERTPGAVLRLRGLLAPTAPVYGISHF
jgi:predicted acetyltransferase